jgi:hypothetical protein
MIFLIDYDRKRARIRLFKAFENIERLDLEISDRADAEVVVLEAADEATLRKTHARYFESASELLNRKIS